MIKESLEICIQGLDFPLSPHHLLPQIAESRCTPGRLCLKVLYEEQNMAPVRSCRVEVFFAWFRQGNYVYVWHTKTTQSPAASKDAADEPSRSLMHIICYTGGLGFNGCVYPKEMPLNYPDQWVFWMQRSVWKLWCFVRRGRGFHTILSCHLPAGEVHHCAS